MATMEYLWSIYLLLMACSLQTVQCFMDMEELKSVYYGLDILSDPIVVTEKIPVGAVHVTSKYGQQYQCTFPDHSSEEKRKEEEEKIAVETGIIEMLKPMGLGDCLFKSKDWWSYEFCYGKYIRQFHMEDGEIKGNIIYLGYYLDDFDWNNETAKEERLRRGATVNRYHSQTYTLGTKCDLTGEMRRAEVRFMCEENSEDYLSRVDESETCVYTVTVMTSRICRHPYLKAPAKRKPVAITCNPILSEDQFQDYMMEIEEEKRKKQQRKAAAASALRKEDSMSAADWERELDKALENEMSSAAKDLLTKPLDELFPIVNRKAMSKEEFQSKFGTDEKAWELYQKGVEVSRSQRDATLRKMSEIRKQMQKRAEKLSAEQEGEESDEKDATERDEDDDVLSEFDDEIDAIKARFKSSQNSLSAIKKKLALEKNWESEIENVIKEAEEELGVKVDRTLISGLSNTLDKLVNKLHDTERELAAVEELEKLKPAKSQKTSSVDDDEEDEDDDDEEESEGKKNTEKPISGLDDKKIENIKGPDSDVIEEADVDSIVQEEDEEGVGFQFGDAGANIPDGLQDDIGDIGDLHSKIQAPPKLGGGRASSPSYMTGFDDEDDDEEEEAETDTAADVGSSAKKKAKTEDEKEITLKKLDDEDVELPKNVKKLLEESVKKEFERHRTQSDSQPLRFDADHSFGRDNTVHVIQQEDEDGKTNKFIFVFGFNTFNDEAAESERQETLEDNYRFVYKGKKSQKQEIPDS